MVRIDGSMGEGGGQVLRAALVLSLLTGEAFEIHRIRERRPRPGLMPQHLAAVQAAAAVGRAEVEGARQGARELAFRPRGLFAGDYHCDIGTAGSTSLVLQTIALPLCFCSGPSSVTLVGGTHVPWSPCFHYLDRHWRPLVQAMGYRLGLSLDVAGFYPRGGGRVRAQVRPHGRLRPLDLGTGGEPRGINGVAAVAGLPLSIAERMRRRAMARLRGRELDVEIALEALPAPSPGAFLMLCVESEAASACHVALGARGKPAERVADECVAGVEASLAGGAPIDPWLADQLLLPLALVPGRSRLQVDRVTGHLLTLAALTGRFLPAEVAIEGREGAPGRVTVDGVAPLPRRP